METVRERLKDRGRWTHTHTHTHTHRGREGKRAGEKGFRSYLVWVQPDMYEAGRLTHLEFNRHWFKFWSKQGTLPL